MHCSPRPQHVVPHSGPPIPPSEHALDGAHAGVASMVAFPL